VVDVLTAGRRFNPYSYSASSLNVYSGPYTCSPSAPACTTPGSICNSLLLPTNVESSCDSNYVDDPNCNCRMLIRECSTSVGQYGNRFWVNGASGDPTYHIARGQIRVSIKYFWPQPTPTPCITVPPTVPSAKVTPILNPYIWQGSLLYVYQSALNFSLSGLSEYYSVQLSQNLYQNTLYSYSVYIMSETTMRDSIYTCIETPQATCTGNAPCNAVWQWNYTAVNPPAPYVVILAPISLHTATRPIFYITESIVSAPTPTVLPLAQETPTYTYTVTNSCPFNSVNTYWIIPNATISSISTGLLIQVKAFGPPPTTSLYVNRLPLSLFAGTAVAPTNWVDWNNVATIPNTNLFGSTTNNIYPSTQVSFFFLTPGCSLQNTNYYIKTGAANLTAWSITPTTTVIANNISATIVAAPTTNTFYTFTYNLATTGLGSPSDLAQLSFNLWGDFMTQGSVTSNNVITWVTGTTILDTACSLTPAQSASTSTATGLTATTLTVPTCRYPLTAALSLNVYRSLPLTCPVNSLSLLPSWSFPYSNIPIYSINPMTPSTFNMYYGDQMILKFTGLTPGNYDFLTFSLGTPLGTSTNFVVNLIKGPPTKVINSGDCPNYSVCSTVSSSLLRDPYATFGAPTADWMNLFVWDRCFHCGSYYSTWFVQIQRIATQTPILDINPFTTAITPILSVVHQRTCRLCPHLLLIQLVV
jgi:hypothetical protein